MDESLKCPNCGATVSISQAVIQSIKDNQLKLAQTKHAQQIADLKAEQAKQQAELIKQHRQSWQDSQAVSDLERNQQLKDAQTQSQHLKDKVEQLLKDKSALAAEKRNFSIKMQEELESKSEEIHQIALRQAEKVYQDQLAEKDKKIADVQKQAQELQLKTSQSSAQLKGEVLELSLEKSLKQAFSDDLIQEVPKGVKGADILQTVRTPQTIACGLIIWESKRTKRWQNEWIDKLKEDCRLVKAHIPAMVSVTLPAETASGILYHQGVWLAKPASALILAQLLRSRLLEVKQVDLRNQYRASSANDLYNYVTGHEFIQNIKATLEIYLDLKTSLNKERAVFEKIWAKREKQAEKMISNTALMLGSMEGIIGSSMPKIEGLEINNLLENKD